MHHLEPVVAARQQQVVSLAKQKTDLDRCEFSFFLEFVVWEKNLISVWKSVHRAGSLSEWICTAWAVWHESCSHTCFKKKKSVKRGLLVTFCSYRALIAVASANQDIQATKSRGARLREAAEVEPSIHAVSMPGVLRKGEERWHVLWVHKFIHLYNE